MTQLPGNSSLHLQYSSNNIHSKQHQNIKMKRLLLFLFVAFTCLNSNAQIKKSTAVTDKKVKELLAKMTLEEKVGQMTQVTLGVVSDEQDGTINPAKLKKAVQDYHVGSILNVTGHAVSVDQWHKILTNIADEANKSHLKIPVLYGLDGIHGQTYTLDATLFPQNIGMAATRNVELAKAITKIAAKELRASGIRWNFAPVLDIGRQPLWSRFPETYGEDVFIGKTMGAAVIKAYEEDGLNNPTAVASCMKHYLGYSASRTGKDRTPIYLPEIEMREYYLPQFREAVKAGASTVMINSSEINGVPVHASKYLLTDVLRKELGFEGLIVTDWADIKRVNDRHSVAATPREAVAMCINAGIDMSMVPADFTFYDLLIEAVKLKEVPMSRIDDAVRKILLLKFNVGLFDNPYPEKEAIANFGRPEYQTLALDAAHEAMTLLKNQNNILPLSKTAKVLVAGPGAQSISTLNGCWSYTWQGKEEQWYPADSKTILQTITAKLGAANVVTTTGKGYDNPMNFDAFELTKAAANVDAIILCLGENAYAESPGNIADLALDENQVALAKAAAASGKPVILVLTEGRPRFISNIEPGMKGILMAYWSGKKTGEAIADVLFGDYNPNGILPYSYPRSMGEVVMYDRKPTEEIREVFNDDIHTGYSPLFEFGYGLSYTSFAYSDLKLSSNELVGDNNLTITLNVKNTGARDGKHTVELYTRDMYASITPNMKRLRAFQKIDLKAGESKTVTFTINKDDLAFVNAQLKTVTEAGDFKIMVGKLSADFKYK
jgi:beta-glucosidase